MDTLLRDPMWTFVGVIFTFLALLATVFIFIIQRKNKNLSYQIISLTSLLGVKEEIAGKVKVLYEGTEVSNVHLLEFRIINNGNQPISSADFEHPLTIVFADATRILTSEIYESSPNEIKGDLISDGHNLLVKPLLLNPKDSISIKALVSNFDGKFFIDGRILGVSRITSYRESTSRLLLLISIIGIFAVFSFHLVGSNYDRPLTVTVLGYQTTLAVMMTLMIFIPRLVKKAFPKLYSWLIEFI